MRTRGKRKYEKGYELEELTLLCNVCFVFNIKYHQCASRNIGLFRKYNRCNVSCNTVKLNVYLERSSGSEDFYSYKKWENVDYNTNSLYFSKEVKVEKGYYYRLRGYHSCTKNGVTENGGSRTNGIYIG